MKNLQVEPVTRKEAPAAISSSDRMALSALRLRKNGKVVFTYLLLIIFLVVAMGPFVIALLAALKTSPELARGVLTLPEVPQWGNFAKAWNQAHFSNYFKSSVIVVSGVVIASTPLAIMMGYAFARLPMRFGSIFFGIVLLGLMVPQEAYIIPLWHNLYKAGLTDTYWAMILPQIGMSMSFGAFWMRGFFSGVQRDLVDAAKVDGANAWQALWQVLVPIAQPAILTMIVLFFVWTWNDFMIALVMVSKEELRTLPLGLAFFQGRHVSDMSLTSAGATMVAIPTMLIYFIFQRQFIRGVTGGAIRG